MLPHFRRELFKDETIRFQDEIPPSPIAEAGESFVVNPFVLSQVWDRGEAAPSDQFFEVFRCGLERPRDGDLIRTEDEKHLVGYAEAEVIVPFDGFGDTFKVKAKGADFGWVHFLFFYKVPKSAVENLWFFDGAPPFGSYSKLLRLHFQFV